jgi:hypothetical protein
LRPASRERVRSRPAPTRGERRNAARMPPFFGGSPVAPDRVPRLVGRLRRFRSTRFCAASVIAIDASHDSKKHIKIFIRSRVEPYRTEATRPTFRMRRAVC